MDLPHAAMSAFVISGVSVLTLAQLVTSSAQTAWSHPLNWLVRYYAMLFPAFFFYFFWGGFGKKMYPVSNWQISKSNYNV